MRTRYGCKFTGKGAYASNSMHLPAKGMFTNEHFSGNGNYWSSTSETINKAYYLYFNLNAKYVSSQFYTVGYSVRPVLAK